jgi:hypothetical protein
VAKPYSGSAVLAEAQGEAHATMGAHCTENQGVLTHYPTFGLLFHGFAWAIGMLGWLLLGGVPLATCDTVLSSATSFGHAPSNDQANIGSSPTLAI